MSYTMEDGDSLYARIAELEKENKELKERVSALEKLLAKAATKVAVVSALVSVIMGVITKLL